MALQPPSESAPPTAADEWLSAAETYRLATAQMPDGQARIAICTRAHSGLLRTHSVRFEKHREVFEDVELPKEFWWATGHEALDQNWITGDFETWIDHNYHWKAFGVRFHRADLLQMLPQPTALAAASTIPAEKNKEELVPSGEALRLLAAASGRRDGAAQILLDGVKMGEITAVARIYQVAVEGGPIITARDKVLEPEDWAGFEEADAQQWMNGILSSTYWDPNARETVTARISGLRLDRTELDAFIASLPPLDLAQPSTGPKGKNPGGRPQAEWWDDLLIAMFRRLWEGNWTPRTQAELVDAMHQWLAANPGDDPAHPRAAGDTALKKRAKKLLAGLDLGR